VQVIIYTFQEATVTEMEALLGDMERGVLSERVLAQFPEFS
jgi:hypothetical protein